MKAGNLYKEIEYLKDYFKAIKKEDGVIFIELVFNQKWKIFNSEDEYDIMVVRNNNDPSSVFFYTEKETEQNLHLVFKHIQTVINYNKELEERVELLSLKMQELKTIFEEESLSKLKKLTFSFKNNKNKGLNND